MYKLIADPLSSYGFSFEGNTGYGYVDGYEVNVVLEPFGNGPVFYFSSYLYPEQKAEFAKRIKEKKIPLITVNNFDLGIALTVSVMLPSGYKKKIPEVLEAVTSILNAIGAPKGGICPKTGDMIDEVDCKTITLPNKAKVKVSNKAVEEINSAVIKSNEDYKNAPNNYFKGFIGVLLGALVGVILTVIFNLMGFITSIAPLISILLGTYLYKKFGGKANATMIVMSFITTLVAVTGVYFLMYTAVASLATEEAGLTYRGIDALSYCLKNVPDFRRIFTVDLSISALFVLLAEGFSIAKLVKDVRRPKNV